MLAEHVNSLEIGVKGMFTEFQLTYEQQMTALNHVFEKIAMLEKIFLTEYTGELSSLKVMGPSVFCHYTIVHCSFCVFVELSSLLISKLFLCKSCLTYFFLFGVVLRWS